VHLADPLGIKGFENRRVKNDLKDAALLADRLRMGRLGEAGMPPGSVRQLLRTLWSPIPSELRPNDGSWCEQRWPWFGYQPS
jgi:hypothetical protein